MGQTAMVGVDIGRAAEVVQALENKGVKLSVALWACLAEFGDWRLILAAREFDRPDPRDGYHLLHDALADAGMSYARTPPVVILRTDDPFVRGLRKLFAKTKSVEGMRLGGQLLGDRYIEDAYAYRIQ